MERHFTLIERTPDRRYALASASVAVLPWSIDYQPPFPHEAIAANTPIVGTYVETYRETAKEQDGFSHAVNSPLIEQLARVLGEYLTNQDAGTDTSGGGV